jgi:hypothetical protein
VTITLDYGLDGADVTGRALTVVSLALAIAVLVVTRRRPTRSATTSDGTDVPTAADAHDPVSGSRSRATMGR